MIRSSAAILIALGLVAGCSAPAESPDDTSADEVTGITDLSEMEGQLGLKKDAKDAHGNWSRSQARLEAGACYKQTRGSAQGANYEFRRYTTGAAFFAKKGTAPATGDERPVLCVDLEVSGEEGGNFILSGAMLDAVLRYKLGNLGGEDAGLGHRYLAFQRGAVEWVDGETECGHTVDSEAQMKPCIAAFNQATAKGEFPTEPYGRTKQILNLSVDPNGTYIPQEVVAMAYRYANKKAKSADAFTMADDPLGRFVGIESAGDVVHARFERMDIHSFKAGGQDQVTVTPKSSDNDMQGSAVARCAGTNAYRCTGL